MFMKAAVVVKETHDKPEADEAHNHVALRLKTRVWLHFGLKRLGQAAVLQAKYTKDSILYIALLQFMNKIWTKFYLRILVC